MSDIEHIETIYLGVDNDGSRAEPPFCAVQRWCEHTMPYVAPTVNNLSQHFCQADRLATDGSISEPYRLACIVPSSMHKFNIKYKSSDALTIYDTFKSYIEIMAPPKCGMIVSIYISNGTDPLVDTSWTAQYLWRTNKIWSKQNCSDNFLTFHDFEPKGVKFKLGNCVELIDLLKEYCLKNGVRLKKLSYSTPVKESYESLLKSKMHFGYIGGTYFLASLTRTPTLGFGLENRKISCFWPDLTKFKSRKIEMDSSLWGQLNTNPGHILRWINDYNGTGNRPVNWQSFTSDPDTVVKQLEKII